jgi:hypothetical protein
MAAREALQEIVPLIDHRRQSVVHSVTRMPKPDEDQWRGYATALRACIADAARQSRGEFHKPLRLCLRSVQERLHDGGRTVAHPQQVRHAPPTERVRRDCGQVTHKIETDR